MNLTTVDVANITIGARNTVNLSLSVELFFVILPREDADSIRAFGNLVELVEEVRVVASGAPRVVKLFVLFA
jgi:hypothetical protein